MLAREQRDIVRELGRKVQALALSDEYEARRRRWRDVNALRKPDRAPVWCKPIGCWGELLPEGGLSCPDEPWRGMERAFRQVLIKDDIGDDSLVEPYYAVPAAIAVEGGHTWGVEVRYIRPAEAGGAWHHDPPITCEADLDKLRPPRFVHDADETQRRLDRAASILDRVMPVKLTAAPPLRPSVAHEASELVGLGNLLLLLAMNPEMCHRLMRFIADGIAASMDQVEAMGVLTENNIAEMYCSDPITTGDSRLGRALSASPSLRIADLWGHSDGQEFGAVSPEMFEEFQLAYERPLLERFGRSSFGCCEDLTRKIDRVLTIRNLRILVASAWTDLDKVIAAVGRKYTIMWRQKATDVVYPADTEPIRRHLDEGCRRLKGQCYQVVCRELQTLAGHPRRLHEWAALAKAAAERHSG